MPVTEQDALRAIQAAEMFADDPARSTKARSIVAAYRSQQDAAGRPYFEDHYRRQAEEDRRFRAMAQDRERHGMSPETFRDFASSVRDPEAQAAFFGSHLLGRVYRRPAKEIRSLGTQYRDEFAKATWGEPVKTWGEFNERMAADFDFEDAIAERAKVNALSGARNLDGLAALVSENKDNPTFAARENDWVNRFNDHAGKLRAMVAPYKPTISFLVEQLQEKTGVADENVAVESYRELAESLLDVPPRDRPLVISAILARGGTEGDGKGVLQKLGESVGRGLQDYTLGIPAFTERGSAIGIRDAIGEEVLAGKAGTPEEYLQALAEKRAGGDAYEHAAFLLDATGSREFAAPSQEIQDAARELANRAVDAVDLRQQLRRVAESGIDPVTSDYMAMRGLYSAARSIPFTLMSLAPGGFYINAAAMAEQTYQDLGERHPDMSAEDKQSIATVSGAIQAGLERISGKVLTGNLKAFKRFANQAIVTRGAVGGRFAARLATGAAIEQSQENAQDLTPDLVQDAFAALSEDVPSVDWEGRFGELARNQGEIFFAVLPLALIGAGVGTVSDYRGGREMLGNYDLLRATGLSEAAASEVRAAAIAGDDAKAQSLLRAGLRETGGDQVTIQEARNEAIPRLIEERERIREIVNRAGDLDIIPAIRNEGGGMWSVEYSDGSGVSFGSYQEADKRRWQAVEDERVSLAIDTIETIRRIDSDIEAGRETKYLFSLEAPTVADAEARGDVSEEAGSERLEIADTVTPDLQREFDEARADADLAGASVDDRKASTRILGSSVNEFRDEVIRTTIRLYQGGTPLTLIEEKTEGDAKYMISQMGQRAWMLRALREWEQASGDRLFRKVGSDEELKNSDIVEAWSALAQAYFVGRSKAGDKGPSFRGSRSKVAKLLRSPMGSAMSAYARLFRAVWKRAAMVEKARRDGTLDEDLEGFLAKSTGMSEQRMFERDVVREGAEVADQIAGDLRDDAGSLESVSDNETTLSVLPNALDLDAEFDRMFSPFQRNPKLRAKLGQAMAERVVKLRDDLDRVANAKRTAANIEREARLREAFEYDRLLRETFEADTQQKQDALPPVDTKAARSEARRLADQWAKDQAREQGQLPRQTLLAFIRTLDAIHRALPAEVRARIGGFVALAQLKEPSAMLDEIKRRVEKVDVELETWMRKEAEKRRKALWKKAQPKRESGKKPKGKLGADVHALFDQLNEVLFWDGDQAEAHAAGLEAKVASGELSADEEAHAILEATLVRLFADWGDTREDTGRRNKKGQRITRLVRKGASAARRIAAIEAAETVWQSGYQEAKKKSAKDRERREKARVEIRTDTGKLGNRKQRQSKAAKDAGFLGGIKEGAVALLNFDQLVSLALGEGSKWARWIADGQRDAEYQKIDEVQAVLDSVEALFTRLGGSRFKGEKLMFDMSRPSFETKQGGEMSQLQGLTALMYWRQVDGRRHMLGKRDEDGNLVSTWSYDQGFIDEISKNLTAEAWEILDFLTEQYGEEWDTLNPIFRDLNGVNMPRHALYSPIKAGPQQAQGGQTVDPVSGVMNTSSRTPGSLRTRAQTVAEPEFVDAIQHFIAHKKELAHWKAFAKFNIEVQAILGNREVANSIEAKGGKELVGRVQSWLDYYAQGGFRDAGSHIALNKGLSRMVSLGSGMAIVGRFGSLAIQATQLTAAAARMPFRAYIKRFSSLMMGRLGWGEALRSEYIQRRLKQMPPHVRIALEGLKASEPNMLKYAVRKIGETLPGADAIFTAGTYAIVFDYQLAQLAKVGMTGPEAQEIARRETERIVDEIAQPTREGARSLLELTATGPMPKLLWAFASEPRKNIGLIAYSSMNRPRSEAVRAALAMIVMNGVIGAIIRTAWRDLRDDDEGDDWDIGKILLAVATEPLYGIPVIGELLQDVAYAAAGEWRPNGSLISAPVQSPKAVIDLLSGEGDSRDVETIITTLGIVNESAAAAASLMHIYRDAEAIVGNLLGD